MFERMREKHQCSGERKIKEKITIDLGVILHTDKLEATSKVDKAYYPTHTD